MAAELRLGPEERIRGSIATIDEVRQLSERCQVHQNRLEATVAEGEVRARGRYDRRPAAGDPAASRVASRLHP